MCGIFGIIGLEDKNLLKRMGDVIKHRGPDDSGYYSDKGVSLGHRRLSIIDLSAKGRQPMSNEDDSIHITYNGEIYNYLELRKDLENKGHKFKSDTDTETIIHLYEEYGNSCPTFLDGMFAFAIWDSNKKKLLLARDRIGKKPLYYHITDDNVFLFASEIKSILQFEGIKKQINPESLNFFLKYRFIPTQHTILDSIDKVPASHVVIWEDNNLKLHKYWDINWQPTNLSEKQSLVLFKRLFNEAVKKRLMSDVPLGVYLSGGLDSSAIVAVNNKLVDEPIKTFTIGFGENTDEFKYAKLVAEKFNTDHHELSLDYNDMTKNLNKVIWHMDEPDLDVSMFPIFFLSKYSKKYVTVVNQGEGADETFAGYSHFKIASNSLSLLPNKIKTKIYVKYYLRFKDYQRKQLLARSVNGDKLLTKHLNKKYPRDLLNRIIAFDLQSKLANEYLMRLDRSTMAFGIEARAPFLDYKLLQFAANLPLNMKLNGFVGKYIVRKSFNNLPKCAVGTRKRVFTTPVHSWFKDNLLDIASDVLSNENVKKRGFFNYKYIKKLLYKQKKSKKQLPLQLFSYQLLTLLVLELWQRMYMDNNAKIMSMNDLLN